MLLILVMQFLLLKLHFLSLAFAFNFEIFIFSWSYQSRFHAPKDAGIWSLRQFRYGGHKDFGCESSLSYGAPSRDYTYILLCTYNFLPKTDRESAKKTFGPFSKSVFSSCRDHRAKEIDFNGRVCKERFWP